MSASPKPIYNAKQYLALEEISHNRSQYYNGEIFAMAGASRAHNIIAGNAGARLHSQLREKSCEIYQSNMRVKINAEFYTYPDIVIVCGKPQIEKFHGDNLLDPIVLIEVISPSTEKFDRGEKSRLYRLMPSVQEYILIVQNKIHVEHFVRQKGFGWLFNELTEIDGVLELTSISCPIKLADIYEKVDF